MGITSILKAVILKNVKIRFHHWLTTILEIVLPMVLFVTLLMIRSKTDDLDKTYIETPSYGSQLTCDGLYNNKFCHGTKIYYAPHTHFTSELMYQIQLKFSLNIVDINGFNNENEMLNETDSEAESIIAVVFENLIQNEIPEQLHYSIRPYEKYVNWDTNILFNPSEPYIADAGSEMYINRGFLAFQMALESSFIEMVSNKSLPINILMTEFPYPPYVQNSEIKFIIQYIISLLTVLSFTIFYPLIISRVMEDKVSGMKELMNVMGLKTYMLWITWFFDIFFWNLISIIGIATMLVYVKDDSGTPLLEHSSIAVLLLFLALYTAAVINLCFVLTTLTNKPLYAMTIAVAISKITYAVSQSLMDKKLPLLKLLLIFPNAGLVFGYNIISEYETRAIGIQWDNIFETSSDDYTMGEILIGFIIQIFVFFAVTLYRSKNCPENCGIPCLWYYPLTWFRNLKKQKKVDIIIETVANEYVEKCDLPISVSVKNLSKFFGNTKSVNNLSIDFYQQQITVLLGKNGAGKTTTLSMIAGLVNPTCGNIIFENSSKSVSICPQHNLQFHALTVLDHLKFYGVLKGLSLKQALEEADIILNIMSLSSKKNSLPNQLSGGMQRKLSLAVAVIGSSNVVILDEPTANLDPASRRDIWDILISLRGYRTIIITTHLMEEAEVLGDQIVIIDHGTLKCHGTPLFLRHKFGVGSSITVTLKNSSETDKFISEITNQHPKYNYDNIDKKNVKISLPNTSNEEIKELLQLLEQCNHISIEHISLTKVTMEEILTKASFIGFECKPLSSKDGDLTSFTRSSDMQVNLWTRFKVLLLKWFQFTRYKLHLIQTLVLTAIILICLYATGNNQSTLHNNDSLSLDLAIYGKTTVLMAYEENDIFPGMVQQYHEIVTSYGSNFKIVEDVSNEIIQRGIKNIEFYKKQMIVAVDFNSINEEPTVTALYSNKAVHGAPISLNIISNALLKTIMGSNYSITAKNHPLPTPTPHRIEYCFMINALLIWHVFFPVGALLLVGISLFCPQLETSSKIKHLQLMCGVSKYIYWFTCYIKDIIFYIISISIVTFIFYATNYLFQLSKVFEGEEVAILFLVLIVFGISVIPYCYLFSYAKSAYVGYGLFLIISLFISNILMILIYYLKFSNNEEMEEYGEMLYKIFLPFPVFGLNYTLMQIIIKSTWNYNWSIKSPEHKNAVCATKYNPCCDGDDKPQCLQYLSYFSGDDSITLNILIMLASTVLYFCILFFIEKRVISKIKKLFKKKIQKVKVMEEESKPFLPEKYLEANIKSKTPVLENVQLKVESGECLGLLGINGAGKTSTFRILAGEEESYDGEIDMKINEERFSIKANKSKYLQNVGYCPQFDELSELTNGGTLLKLFAKLRNVEDVDKEVNKFLNVFELNKYSKQQCSTYSGGNKRKLFTAIALIGIPPFIMLDEPTAGVDPSSRRKIWEALSHLKQLKQSSPSIILSTHSMQECEVLCKKIVSIKSGKIEPNASGSIYDLKNKYKEDFTVTLKLKYLNIFISSQPTLAEVLSPQQNRTEQNSCTTTEDNTNTTDIQKLKRAVLNAFTDCEIIDQHVTLLKYRIRKKDRPLSGIFKVIEGIQSDYPIVEDYDISEVTLETLFLNTMKQFPK